MVEISEAMASMTQRIYSSGLVVGIRRSQKSGSLLKHCLSGQRALMLMPGGIEFCLRSGKCKCAACSSRAAGVRLGFLGEDELVAVSLCSRESRGTAADLLQCSQLSLRLGRVDR